MSARATASTEHPWAQWELPGPSSGTGPTPTPLTDAKSCLFGAGYREGIFMASRVIAGGQKSRKSNTIKNPHNKHSSEN